MCRPCVSAWYETRRPRRILDGYSGAGGAAHGYAAAGFEVTGVDSNPKLRDAYLRSGAAGFICADVLEVLADTSFTAGFDFIHASPPCQAHSAAKNIRQGYTRHPDLIAPTRDRLSASGLPYVIENVPGSPLISPVLLCGLAFGLNVKRHRMFESSLKLPEPPSCPAGHPGNWVTVFGGGAPCVPGQPARRASAGAHARRWALTG